MIDAGFHTVTEAVAKFVAPVTVRAAVGHIAIIVARQIPVAIIIAG
jgi:hypothetical protein